MQSREQVENSVKLFVNPKYRGPTSNKIEENSSKTGWNENLNKKKLYITF